MLVTDWLWNYIIASVAEIFAAREEYVTVQLQRAVNRSVGLEIVHFSVLTGLTNGKYLVMLLTC
jgi:hypothetical protein